MSLEELTVTVFIPSLRVCVAISFHLLRWLNVAGNERRGYCKVGKNGENRCHANLNACDVHCVFTACDERKGFASKIIIRASHYI